jgi:hypothetical protein
MTEILNTISKFMRDTHGAAGGFTEPKNPDLEPWIGVFITVSPRFEQARFILIVSQNGKFALYRNPRYYSVQNDSVERQK